MRSIKRSIKSISYYWKRNLLLSIAFFAITIVLLIMASMRSNIETAVDELGKRIGTDLVVRREGAVTHSYRSANYYPIGALEEIKEWVEVDDIDYLTMTNAKGVNVKEVPSSLQAMSKEAAQEAGRDYYASEEERKAGEITIIGVSNIDKSWEFEKRGAVITEGKGFSEEDADYPLAVVSERFLEWNFLKLGDEITVSNSSDSSRSVTFTVVGTHSENYESNLVADSRMNFIYVPLRQGLVVSKGEILQTTIHVNNPYNSKIIVQKIQSLMKKNAGDEAEVLEERMTYLTAITPLKGIQKVCWSMLWMIYGIIVLVLVLVSAKLILIRKKEIGTWMAVGEKKFNIILQLLSEISFPIMGGMILGSVFASVFEEQIGRAIINMMPSFENIKFSISPILGVGIIILTLFIGIIVEAVILLQTMRCCPKKLL